jgi:eukaryotic-like serine/threonine-protein kinase
MRIQASDNLAVILMRQGKVAEALPLLEPTLAAARRRYAPDNPVLAVHIHNYASALLLLKRPADAEPLIREALAIRQAKFGDSDPRTVGETCTLARALYDQQRFDEAESLLTATLAKLGPETEEPARQRCRSELAQLYQAWGKPDKAAEFQPAP